MLNDVHSVHRVHQVQRKPADRPWGYPTENLGLPCGNSGVTAWKSRRYPVENFGVTPAIKIARFATKTLVSNDLSKSLVIKLTKTSEIFLLNDQN
jgi:hypothetical protein